MNNVSRLTSMLLELKEKKQDSNIKSRDLAFLSEISSSDVALAQQNAIEAGLDATQLWKLWQENRKILPDIPAKLSSELPSGHVLQRVIAEHQMILCFIADLDEISYKIHKLNQASSATSEIRQLAHIAEHLVYAEQHAQREDQVIFPQLQKQGYSDLLVFISQQHHQIGQKHNQLNELVWQIDTIDFSKFKTKLQEIADFIVVALRLHIFIENNIVFPLAVKVISDQRIWKRMKDICSELGYCAYDAK